MKRRTFIKSSTAAALGWFVAPGRPGGVAFQGPTVRDLEAAFVKPPANARPHTWWHWMNGNISADGITRDLEAMARVGVGGVQMFDVGTGIPKGPVETLSPEWLRLVRHAASEANRLGLSFTMHNCPGWSSSGGPWVTPDRAMQQLVWSETTIDGGLFEHNGGCGIVPLGQTHGMTAVCFDRHGRAHEIELAVKFAL